MDDEKIDDRTNKAKKKLSNKQKKIHIETLETNSFVCFAQSFRVERRLSGASSDLRQRAINAVAFASPDIVAIVTILVDIDWKQNCDRREI